MACYVLSFLVNNLERINSPANGVRNIPNKNHTKISLLVSFAQYAQKTPKQNPVKPKVANSFSIKVNPC